MLLVFLLLLNYLIVSARLRLSQQLFPSRTIALSWSFVTGAVIAAGLALYPSFTQRLWLSQLQYTLSYLPINALLAGFCYSMILGAGIICIVRWTRVSRRRFLWLYLIVVICTLILYFMTWRWGVSAGVLYFLVAASIEEAAKYTTGQALTNNTEASWLPSDTIIIALVVALGFAFLENAVYLRSSIGWVTTTRTTLWSGLGMLLSRGAISFAIHGVFTGTIARLVLRSTKHLSWKKYLSIALAFLAGIFLHSGRNLLLFFNIQRAIVFSIIGVYILLTYLLYQSESIYLKERIA